MRKGHFGAALLALACGVFHAGESRAQNRAFASDGRVVIGAERMTGVFFEKLKTVSTNTFDMGGMPVTVETEENNDTTTFALLGQSSGLGGIFNTAGGPSATPRLGVDVFVASGFSIGGSLMYWTASGTSEETQDPPDPNPQGEQDQPTVNLLILNPRVGFGYAVSPSFAIWPRVGFSYARYGIHDEDEDPGPPAVTTETDVSITTTNLTLEFMMAVTPLPNVAILFGPIADIGVGGSSETEQDPPDPTPPEDVDVTYTAFGLSAGLGVVF